VDVLAYSFALFKVLSMSLHVVAVVVCWLVDHCHLCINMDVLACLFALFPLLLMSFPLALLSWCQCHWCQPGYDCHCGHSFVVLCMQCCIVSPL